MTASTNNCVGAPAGLTDEQSKWHSLSCGLRTSIRLGCTCKAAPRQPEEMGAEVQCNHDMRWLGNGSPAQCQHCGKTASQIAAASAQQDEREAKPLDLSDIEVGFDDDEPNAVTVRFPYDEDQSRTELLRKRLDSIPGMPVCLTDDFDGVCLTMKFEDEGEAQTAIDVLNAAAQPSAEQAKPEQDERANNFSTTQEQNMNNAVTAQTQQTEVAQQNTSVTIPARLTPEYLSAMVAWREMDANDELKGEAQMMERIYSAIVSVAKGQ